MIPHSKDFSHYTAPNNVEYEPDNSLAYSNVYIPTVDRLAQIGSNRRYCYK